MVVVVLKLQPITERVDTLANVILVIIKVSSVINTITKRNN